MNFIRLVIFTLLVPGTIAWWIPSWLTRRSPAGFDIGPLNYCGVIFIMIGASLYLRSAVAFLNEGKGTPAIWFTKSIGFLIGEEPSLFVSGALYKHTRNPMYVGVILTVVGEAVLFQKAVLLEYALALCFFFHLVVVLIEEPHLRKKYGHPYEEYLRSTPRWFSLKQRARVEREIVFLGDSITEGCNWSSLLHNPAIKNHGVGGDTTEGVLKRLAPIIGSQPRQVFLMVGINDLWNAVPIQFIADNYRNILSMFKTKSPMTHVSIQSILPMNRAWSSSPVRVAEVNTLVVALNNILRALADEFQYSYINLHDLFVNNGQLDLQYTDDGLHLNHKGYMKWKAAIEHLIS